MDRLLAGGSLGLNVLTVGFALNYGSLKGGKQVGTMAEEAGEAGDTGLAAWFKRFWLDESGGVPLPAGNVPKRIPFITPGSLPAAEDVAILTTLRHIDNETKPAGALAKKWGAKFKNWAGDLPGNKGELSPYREYRVASPDGTTGGGIRRIVVNETTGEAYYSWTHYGDTGNPPFVQIR